MDLGLQGKRALVTGSSASIGAAIAEAAVRIGAMSFHEFRSYVKTRWTTQSCPGEPYVDDEGIG